MSESEKTEQKRSFVSDADAPQPERKEQQVPTIEIEGKKTPILKAEVSLMLCYGKLNAILDELKMLNGIFKEAFKQTTFQTPANPQKIEPTAQSTAPLVMPPKQTEQTPRVKEILTALEPVKDLLKIDLDGSSMFVMVRPASFLGQENFGKVASIVRALGGQYVSAGKNSHFEISKAPPRK